MILLFPDVFSFDKQLGPIYHVEGIYIFSVVSARIIQLERASKHSSVLVFSVEICGFFFFP